MRGVSQGCRLVAAGLFTVLALVPVASAQEVDAGGEDVVSSDAPSVARPARARTDDDPPADELAEVSSGPTLQQRQMAARRGRPLDRPDYSSDPSDPDLPVAVQLALGGGSTVMGSSFDLVLQSHDYSSSGAFYLGDVTVLGRITDWLFVGGRFGGRGRTFVRNDGPGGSAGVVDLQVIAMVRFQLGRVIDLGIHGGAGAGVVGVALHDAASSGIAPRVTAGLHIGFRIGHGVRLMIRGSYDFCRWYGMDRYGDELELGGLSAAIGLEVRS